MEASVGPVSLSGGDVLGEPSLAALGTCLAGPKPSFPGEMEAKKVLGFIPGQAYRPSNSRVGPK